MNLIGITLKNLFHKKMRAILTICGVGVSISAFVALMGLTRSLEESLATTYKTRGTDLIVMEKGTVDILSSSIEEGYLEKIKGLAGIEEAQAILVDLYALKLKQYILVYGWDFDSYLFNELKVSGRFPRFQDELLLGEMAAKRLNKKTGDRVKIRNAFFTVVGIFQSKSLIEDGAIIMALSRLQELKRNKGKVTVLNLKVRRGVSSGQRESQEVPEVERMQERLAQLYPDLEVKNIQAFMSSNNPLSLVLGFTWAISIVAFIIVILGIANTMITSVLERTQEIGILLAIGFRKAKIVALVLYESVVLGFFGGIIGIISGYVLMHVLVSTSRLQGVMTVTYDFRFIGLAMLSSLCLGFISGLYPALRAVSIQPMRVLRYG